MASTNEEVAALLREYAELLELTGSDSFRVRSYERAARSVGGYPGDLAALPDSGLTKVSGVGASTAAKIAEIRRTGTFAALEELRRQVPSGANRLVKVPGVGQKRALQLAARGITTAGELEEALRRGRLRDLPGFGPKSEERIARGLGVAEGDTELREALQALPRNAGEDEIYAVLAAHIPGAAAADGNDQAPVRTTNLRGTCTRTPTSPTA